MSPITQGRVRDSLSSRKAGNKPFCKSAAPASTPSRPKSAPEAPMLVVAGRNAIEVMHEAMPLRVSMILGKLLRDHGALREMGRCAREVALPGAASRIAERVLAIGGGE